MKKLIKEIIHALKEEMYGECVGTLFQSEKYCEGWNDGIKQAIEHITGKYLDYEYEVEHNLLEKELVKNTIREFFQKMAEKKMYKSEKKQMKYINMLLRFNLALQTQIDQIEKNDGWILTEKRLPEVPEGTADEDCPEFNVMIEGAERATTLQYSWDGTWFDDSGNLYKVIAWRPLPEAYKL